MTVIEANSWLELKHYVEDYSVQEAINFIYDSFILYIVGKEYEEEIASYDPALQFKPDYHKA